MAMKRFSTFYKAPESEPQHQMVYVISKTLVGVGEVLFLCRDAISIFCQLALFSPAK